MNTTQLLHKLSESKDVKKFIEEYESEFRCISCSDFINDVLAQKDLSVAKVAKESGQGEYAYKVIRGERKPSRDVLITIAIGLELNLDETQLLLRIAKWAILDPRDKRDSIIIYGINERKTVEQLNDLLYDMEQQTL